MTIPQIKCDGHGNDDVENFFLPTAVERGTNPWYSDWGMERARLEESEKRKSCRQLKKGGNPVATQANV
jgi:hypothetical protein